MRLDEFDYPLDEALIAQYPIEPRDQARLLVIDRRCETSIDSRFDALPSLLRPGDLLVLNNTRVIPARLRGCKRPGGGKVEVLLVRPLTQTHEGETWQAMIRGKIHPGQQLELPHGIVASVTGSEEGRCRVTFPPRTDVLAYAEKAGEVPLPPYIRRPPAEADRNRYQTVFARHPGAIAAPTAGLHFTDPLLTALRKAGIQIATVTLHVGPGTFKPVTSQDIRDHKMDAEWYEVSEETAKMIGATRRLGGRVIGVGSTSVRALETAANDQSVPMPGVGVTSLFIYPGYEFKIVDAMLTNFHLPKSTLFMLVCAFAGRQRMLDAYRFAAVKGYRFYSYGDAMLIL
jgi:S-adenosylmethionine:tRNA ribosyltransferase-isomerase